MILGPAVDQKKRGWGPKLSSLPPPPPLYKHMFVRPAQSSITELRKCPIKMERSTTHRSQLSSCPTALQHRLAATTQNPSQADVWIQVVCICTQASIYSSSGPRNSKRGLSATVGRILGALRTTQHKKAQAPPEGHNCAGSCRLVQVLWSTLPQTTANAMHPLVFVCKPLCSLPISLNLNSLNPIQRATMKTKMHAIRDWLHDCLMAWCTNPTQRAPDTLNSKPQAEGYYEDQGACHTRLAAYLVPHDMKPEPSARGPA